MSYRDDMPEEERKARQRESTAAYRERQRLAMADDPWYDAVVRWKGKESDASQRAKINADPNKRAAKNAQWMAWHNSQSDNEDYKESKRESTKKSYWANRDQRLAEQKVWREDNDRSEYNLEWSRANTDKRAEGRRRRKALLKGATTIETFTKVEIWERDEGVCGICDLPADTNDWHLDHVIPLSRGGQHTWENVQVSHPKCNLSKKAKLPSEMADTLEVYS